MIKVTVGDKIPLFIQLYDANPDAEVSAVVIDRFGAEIGRAELEHKSGGLYTGEGPEMPPTGPVFAQYAVPGDYEVASDAYQPVPKVEEPIKALVGEVVKMEELKEIIIGEVHDTQETENPEQV